MDLEKVDCWYEILIDKTYEKFSSCVANVFNIVVGESYKLVCSSVIDDDHVFEHFKWIYPTSTQVDQVRQTSLCLFL